MARSLLPQHQQAASALTPHMSLSQQKTRAKAIKPAAPPARKKRAVASAAGTPGKLPGWSKAAPITLKPHASVDDAMHAIMTACQLHWHRNLAAAIDGRQPEGTHQVRVGLRRFRSALSIFKKHIPAAQREALNAEAKWILTQLGQARDLDVFIDSLAAPVAARASEDPGVAQVIRAARHAQSKAHAVAAKALRGARVARFNARVEAWLAGRGWHIDENAKRDGKAVDFARKFLNRRLRNLIAEYNDIESLDTAARHELRIATKKIRYGLEFFQSLLPAKRTRLLASTLKHLQDNLGHLNDIDVAERTVSLLVNSSATGTERRMVVAGGKAISAFHQKAAEAAESETFKLWRKMKRVPAL